MATGGEVMAMLRPEGGWAITGDDFDGIQFIDCTPVTKNEFEEGFAAFDAWKIQQDAAKTSSKQSLLDRLGITADEAKLLLS